MRADEKRLLLEHASSLFGGAEELAEKLGIGQRRAESYLSGNEPVTDAVFLRLMDLLGEDPHATVVGFDAKRLLSSS
jgi:hypothetical protein